ncbi:AIPR family protein [Alcaligenaceae bacterium B3P038]|nr:AIPR family protein [Alcaligenaceae bacterium B3P038]
MELEDFRKDVLESARIRSESKSNFTVSSFVEEMLERLELAEVLADASICRYESGNSKMRVDAYSYDDTDNSLSIVVVDYSNQEELLGFVASDINKGFDSLRAFIEASIEGILTDGSFEESHPAHGLASDIIDWQDKIVRYRLYYVSDLLSRAKAKDWPDILIAGTPAELHIWDIARFYQSAISATGRDSIVVRFDDSGGSGLPCLPAAGAEGEYRAYLCMIPGEVLAKIYDKYGSRLLEGNVRSFLSARGKVNAKIQSTIRSRPEMFFAFNNGIAATAEGIEFSDDATGLKIISLTNLQIVNGGQTTASLALAGRSSGSEKKGADLSKIMVPMKLSVLPPTSAGALIPDIARYANSQNKVSDADFFANHPFHIRLEEFSRRIFAPAIGGAQYGTHWFYERARGQYINEMSGMTASKKKQFELQNPKSKFFTKTDVAKFDNTWRRLPHKVSAGAQKNFTIFAEYIAKVWSEDETQFNEQYFKNLVAIAILFRSTEALVKNQDWYQGGYRANIVTYAIAKLRDMVSEQALGYQLDLKTIWEKQEIPQALNDQILIICRRVFEILTAPDRPKDNVTEWAKMQACWDRIQTTQISINKNLLEALESLAESTRATKKAKDTQKLDDGLNVQIAVLELKSSEWSRLKSWGAQNQLLTPAQAELLVLASKIPHKLPNEKQCLKIWEIRQGLIDQGFE